MDYQELVRRSLSSGIAPNPWQWQLMLRRAGIRDFAPGAAAETALSPGLPGVPSFLAQAMPGIRTMTALGYPYLEPAATAATKAVGSGVKSVVDQTKEWLGANDPGSQYGGIGIEPSGAAASTEAASKATSGYSPGNTLGALANLGSTALSAYRGDVPGSIGGGLRLGGNVASYAGYPGVSAGLGGAGGLLSLAMGIKNRDPMGMVSAFPGLASGVGNLATAWAPSAASMAGATGLETAGAMAGAEAGSSLAGLGAGLSAASLPIFLATITALAGLSGGMDMGGDMFTPEPLAAKQQRETQRITEGFGEAWPDLQKSPDYLSELSRQRAMGPGGADWDQVLASTMGSSQSIDRIPALAHFLSTGGGRQSGGWGFDYEGTDVSGIAPESTRLLTDAYLGQLKGLDFLHTGGQDERYTGTAPNLANTLNSFRDIANIGDKGRFFPHGLPEPFYKTEAEPGPDTSSEFPTVSSEWERWDRNRDFYENNEGSFDLRNRIGPGGSIEAGPWGGRDLASEFRPGAYESTVMDVVNQINPDWRTNSTLGEESGKFGSTNQFSLDRSPRGMGEGALPITQTSGRSSGSGGGSPSATADPIGGDAAASLNRLMEQGRAFLGSA